MRGFAGITHVLIALGILGIALNLLPLHDWWIVLAVPIVSGAALLPDIDNRRSTAYFQLGPAGRTIHSFMYYSSYIVTRISWGKDWIPDSQHRCLWHTPFIGFCLIGFFWFMPSSDRAYFLIWYEATSMAVFTYYFTAHLCVFISLICIYLGVQILTHRIFKFFPKIIKQLSTKLIILLLSGAVFFTSVSDLKYLGILIGLGYLFHIFADTLTKGSAPVFWPIPLPVGWWWRPKNKVFGRIDVDSKANRFINILFSILSVLLLVLYVSP